MERVRSAKFVHVPVPAPLAPVMLSREERQQLRVIKHRAFQRHQQNAMWTRSVFTFDGVTHRLSDGNAADDNEQNDVIHSTSNDDTADAAASHMGSDASTQQQQQQRTTDSAQLRDQIDAKARAIASTKQQIARFEFEQRANQEKFEALLAGLKSIADSAALASFHERVEQAREQLLPPSTREREVVKL